MNSNLGIWDGVNEIEIDTSWREGKSSDYYKYRELFEKAQNRDYIGEFPLCLEIEASYYCNLKCPFCPRVVDFGERKEKHMATDVWPLIVAEIKKYKMPSILMDHEAESLMNKNFFNMLADVKNAGVHDIFLHTNANILTRKISEKLIDGGITKINFSIDAATPETYAKRRVGGNFERVIRNVSEFLELKLEKKAKHIRVRVSFVAAEENNHERESFYKFWSKKEGVNLITFQECIDFGVFNEHDEDNKLTDEELSEKYLEETPFKCSMPWEMPVIDVDGNISPCGVPVREKNKDFFLGNLTNGDTIESCWKGEKIEELRDLHQSGNWYLNSTCRACVKERLRIEKET